MTHATAQSQLGTITGQWREQSRLKVTDGLRGLAVTAVVLFHSVPSLAPGGFIGVDIFFVISGFVISLVYEQPLGSRSVTFGRFYVRRIKRLGPAYFGLVAATTVGALAVMRPHDLTNYGWSLLSQAVYMQNVAFWTIGDYFENALAKPLLHTWSLAVEEQFYLLFPFLVLAIRHRPRLRNWLLVALTLGSFLVGVAITAISPKTSFYWLPTRAWEFAVGFMVVAGYSKQPISGAIGTTFALAGALLVLVSVFAFSSHSGMPSLQTILAVAGASAVLWSQNARGTAFLATGPPQFFGRISYSWYRPARAGSPRHLDGHSTLSVPYFEAVTNVEPRRLPLHRCAGETNLADRRQPRGQIQGVAAELPVANYQAELHRPGIRRATGLQLDEAFA